MATEPSFAPTASIVINTGTVSANATLPVTGTPTITLPTNLGEVPIFAALGASGSLAATAPDDLVVMPYASGIPVTIGKQHYHCRRDTGAAGHVEYYGWGLGPVTSQQTAHKRARVGRYDIHLAALM